MELLYIKKDTIIYEISQKYYIGTINTLFSDCKEFQTDIREYNNFNVTPDKYNESLSSNKASVHKYDESIFAEFVINYNKCKGGGVELQIIKKSPIITRTGFFIGVTTNKLTYDTWPYKDVNFEGGLTPSLGLFGSITYKEFIAFQSNIVYTYFKSSGSLTAQGDVLYNGAFFVTPINAHINHKVHLVQIPLFLKLNLFKISNIQLYLKGGFSFDLAILNNSKATANPVDERFNSKYNDKINFPTLNTGFIWGGGFNIHNKNNNKIYFVDFGVCNTKTGSTPITSYSWSAEKIAGTINYFSIRLGKSF